MWYATAKITHATILKVQAVQGVSGIRVVHIFDPIGGTERKDFGDFLEPSEAASSSERSSEGSGSDRASFGGSVGVSEGVLVVAGGASGESAVVGGG